MTKTSEHGGGVAALSGSGVFFCHKRLICLFTPALLCALTYALSHSLSAVRQNIRNTPGISHFKNILHRKEWEVFIWTLETLDL